MTTRCKFICTSVTKARHWDVKKGFLYSAEFSPVMSASPENQQFFEATPAGTLKVSTYKEDTFEPGKSYYLDITEATEG